MSEITILSKTTAIKTLYVQIQELYKNAQVEESKEYHGSFIITLNPNGKVDLQPLLIRVKNLNLAVVYLNVYEISGRVYIYLAVSR